MCFLDETKTGGEKDKFILASQAEYPFNQNSDGLSDFVNQVPLTGSGFFLSTNNHVFYNFCPWAGQALPFPVDEKEAKILSKRTLRRAF